MNPHPGDAYIVPSTGTAWPGAPAKPGAAGILPGDFLFFDGTTWHNGGEIQGPKGDPGAAQGPVGPAGPTAVSTDAGNIAKLGTDGKVLVDPITHPENTVTENTVSGQTPTTNAPANPINGDVFINRPDTSTWVYDGAAWKPLPAPHDRAAAGRRELDCGREAFGARHGSSATARTLSKAASSSTRSTTRSGTTTGRPGSSSGTRTRPSRPAEPLARLLTALEPRLSRRRRKATGSSTRWTTRRSGIYAGGAWRRASGAGTLFPPRQPPQARFLPNPGTGETLFPFAVGYTPTMATCCTTTWTTSAGSTDLIHDSSGKRVAPSCCGCKPDEVTVSANVGDAPGGGASFLHLKSSRTHWRIVRLKCRLLPRPDVPWLDLDSSRASPR